MTINELNFSKIIQIDCPDCATYCIRDYFDNNSEHYKINSYCTLCEEKGINNCPWEENFSLRNISHGAHSKDFIAAFDKPIDTTSWFDSGVMFVMESPSKDYKIYRDLAINKDGKEYNKRPSGQWYWVHDKMSVTGYPQYFTGGEYGNLVASAILTFRLSNAYLTNLIKCGMNDSTGEKFKGIGWYNPDCVETCFENILKKEIEIIQPKVIFTFGTKVYDYLNPKVGNKIKVVGLPHPAGRRRGFKNDYYNVLYFCMMAKWLLKENVINQAFYNELMQMFEENE